MIHALIILAALLGLPLFAALGFSLVALYTSSGLVPSVLFVEFLRVLREENLLAIMLAAVAITPANGTAGLRPGVVGWAGLVGAGLLIFAIMADYLAPSARLDLHALVRAALVPAGLVAAGWLLARLLTVSGNQKEPAGPWWCTLPLVPLLVCWHFGWLELVEAAALAALAALSWSMFRNEEDRGREILDRISNGMVTPGATIVLVAMAISLGAWLVDHDVSRNLFGGWIAGDYGRTAYLLVFQASVLAAGILVPLSIALVLPLLVLLPVATAFGVDVHQLGVVAVMGVGIGRLVRTFLARQVQDEDVPGRTAISLIAAVWIAVAWWPPLTLWAAG